MSGCYFRKISLDEMEGAAAGGRCQVLGQRGWGPGVGQGLRKEPLTLGAALAEALVPWCHSAKENPFPCDSLSISPQHTRFHSFTFGRKSPHCS